MRPDFDDIQPQQRQTRQPVARPAFAAGSLIADQLAPLPAFLRGFLSTRGVEQMAQEVDHIIEAFEALAALVLLGGRMPSFSESQSLEAKQWGWLASIASSVKPVEALFLASQVASVGP